MSPGKKEQILASMACVAMALCCVSGMAGEVNALESGSCRYDKDRMLSLEYQAFDQTPGQGWRELTPGDLCLVEAADLIRDYRTTRDVAHPMLYWHEGQLRALSGSIAEAVPLMELSRPMAAGIKGWSEYLDATVAFLRNDRTAFEKARAALASVPGTPYSGVIERLGRCFGLPYKQSYRTCEK